MVNMQNKRKKAANLLLTFTSLSLLSACSLAPNPITLDEHIARAKVDRTRIESRYVPLDGSITLSSAIARALKYNYDVRLAKLEQNEQEKQLDLSIYQMLPRLSADAGYTSRDNYSASESINVRTKDRSLDYSFSEDKARSNGNVMFSWNLLDVGISYFQAKQQGYRALIAVERRRKVIEGIVKSVSDSYWRAAAANRILPELDALKTEAEKMLRISQEISGKNLQPPLELLDFQQKIIQLSGELEKIRNELTAAQVQLASLINVPPTSLIKLATSPEDVKTDRTIDIRSLEDIGLVMRPELRIEAYQQKINRQDVYKEIIKMMPGIGVLATGNYDTNTLLYNHTWSEMGVRATLNLTNMIQGPQAISAAKSTVALSEERRLALGVAVITQINLAYQQYKNALSNLQTVDKVDTVSKQMVRVSENASRAGAQSAANRIRYKLTGIIADLEKDRAISQAHTSLAELYSSVGVDIVPADADTDNLNVLTEKVNQSIKKWENGLLPSQEEVLNVYKQSAQPMERQ